MREGYLAIARVCWRWRRLKALLLRCFSCAQERLDPIDWATYEPYLWANEAAYSQRVSILFGALGRLARSTPPVSFPPLYNTADIERREVS